MTIMKFSELKKKTREDLQKEESRIELDLLRLRGQIATGGAGKDAGKARSMKRTIARIRTITDSKKTKKEGLKKR